MGSSSASARSEAPLGLREQQRQFTRQRLVEACVQVFDEKGYVNARIDDIVERAGASRATFYLHFKSKADVAREAMRPLVGAAIPHYSDLTTLGNPTWQDLRGWMDQLVTHWRENRAAINAVQQASVVEPELAGEFVASVRDTVHVLGPWVAAVTGVDEAVADLRATVWLLQMERVSFFWMVRDVPFDGPALLDVLTDSLWAALHPERTSRSGRRARR